MRVLGLDTATWRASVGVLDDGAVVAEETAWASGSHAVSLLPLIERVLQRAGCAIEQLDAIAVSRGPGSFTGLRIGLSVAKGLACAAGLRVVAVPTLEALARTVADRAPTICALLDARKGELYAACFTAVDGWRRLTDDVLLPPEKLLPSLPTPCAIVGDAVDSYGELLHRRFNGDAIILPFEIYGPRGGTVARLGVERLQRGDGDALADLEPVYIRPSEAELKSP